MAGLTLFTYSHHHASSNKIRVAAAFAGVELNVADKDEAPSSVSQQPLAAIRNFDSRWPVLLTAEEGHVWGSSAIARYVCRVAQNECYLLGWGSRDEALVDQWVDFVTGELQLPINALVYPLLGIMQISSEEKEIATRAVLSLLRKLDDYLLDRTFFVGEYITLADVSVACALLDLYIHVLDEKLVKSHQNVTRWFLTCMHQPHFVETLGTPKYLAAAHFKKLAKSQAKQSSTKGTESQRTADENNDDNDDGLTEEQRQHHSELAVRMRNAQQVARRSPQADAVHDALAHIAMSKAQKKLTEKDIQNKAVPSVYSPALPTKDSTQRLHQSSSGSLKNIHQPK